MDLEDQVHAILGQLDDLGNDARRETAAAAVDFDDPKHVALHARTRVHHAGTQGDFVAQDIVFDSKITFERDPVDDRVLDDLHHDPISVPPQYHVGEQTGFEQTLEGLVEIGVGDRIAGFERQIRADGIGFDPLDAFDLDLPDRTVWVLGARTVHRRHDQKDRGEGANRPGKPSKEIQHALPQAVRSRDRR